MEKAVRNLLDQLDKRILGLPNNPWIPGTEFADGQLMAAISAVRSEIETQGL